MSLNYLGIARSPLHRQLTSPRASPSRESSSSQDLTQDSKDVLLERLNDLVARLSKPLSLNDAAISSVHAEVDKIEKVVRSAERHDGLRGGSVSPENQTSRESDTFWGPPSPSFRMQLPHPLRNSQGRRGMGAANAIQLAKEAEDLASKLSVTVKELQARREESDHIHDLLVTRVEKSTERILFLEYRIAEIEEDFENNQSELKFLRIQMQAIETQASQYIPQDEDLDLTESILNWKVDWENIEKRAKTRRKKHKLSLTPTAVSGS